MLTESKSQVDEGLVRESVWVGLGLGLGVISKKRETLIGKRNKL